MDETKARRRVAGKGDRDSIHRLLPGRRKGIHQGGIGGQDPGNATVVPVDHLDEAGIGKEREGNIIGGIGVGRGGGDDREAGLEVGQDLEIGRIEEAGIEVPGIDETIGVLKREEGIEAQWKELEIGLVRGKSHPKERTTELGGDWEEEGVRVEENTMELGVDLKMACKLKIHPKDGLKVWKIQIRIGWRSKLVEIEDFTTNKRRKIDGNQGLTSQGQEVVQAVMRTVGLMRTEEEEEGGERIWSQRTPCWIDRAGLRRRVGL